MTEKEDYSPQEIAEKFNIKPRTVAAWIRSGKLKAISLESPQSGFGGFY